MKIKTIIYASAQTSLFVVMLLCFSTNAFALTFNVDGIRYTTYYGKQEVYVEDCNINVYRCEIVIPSVVTADDVSYPVTGIGQSAFSDCNMARVIIPNTITVIENRAFSECVELTSIDIPFSVSKIGEQVFSGCNGLLGITVDSHNQIFDSRDNCNAIIESSTNTLIVGCQNTKIPSSVTAIGDYAFYNCENLTNIQIPDSVTSIGLDAFFGTQLFNNQVGIVYAGLWAIGFNGEIPEEQHMTFRPGTIGISDGSFMKLNRISLEIPKSVMYIGRSAFRTEIGEIMPLTSIVIGESVKTIGREAFFTGSSDNNWGTNLKKITCLAKIPPKNESYLYQPFDTYVHNNYGTQIGGAFSGEVVESRTTYNGELEYFLFILSYAIYKEATLYVPRGSIEAYKSAEDWCRFINIVAMPDHFDVNGDYEVTIADVNGIIEVIQHGSNDQYNTNNSDVNDDGEVTIADVNAVINAIVGN